MLEHDSLATSTDTSTADCSTSTSSQDSSSTADPLRGAAPFRLESGSSSSDDRKGGSSNPPRVEPVVAGGGDGDGSSSGALEGDDRHGEMTGSLPLPQSAGPLRVGGGVGGGVGGHVRTHSSASSVSGVSSSMMPLPSPSGQGHGHHAVPSSPPPSSPRRCSAAAINDLLLEVWSSGEVLFRSKITWLLMLGPVALIGDFTGLLGEATCFCFAAGALIPCAERLSFVTEQVAAHTNETFGALLNATFGNAPELLISCAALRAGFYRVVQLTLLGSVLTNLLLVFGVSCVVGGWRWKVQEVRTTSGNVSIGMLFIATAGLVLPAALKMNNQAMFTGDGEAAAEIQFSRVNAAIMMSMYVGYLVFQLKTHKDEFDDNDDQQQGQRNPILASGQPTALHTVYSFRNDARRGGVAGGGGGGGHNHVDVEMACVAVDNVLSKPRSRCDEESGYDNRTTKGTVFDSEGPPSMEETDAEDSTADVNAAPKPQSLPPRFHEHPHENGIPGIPVPHRKRRNLVTARSDSAIASVADLSTADSADPGDEERVALVSRPIKARGSDILDPNDIYDPDADASLPVSNLAVACSSGEEALISFRAGIVWLFAITLCISAMSDIIVQTIDGFALRLHLGEVFTALVVVPIFSNIAEQTSAILFAYRNKMDLCVGITVGSAIQISLFVLPGCVLIGWIVDRSMSLFFQGFETVCLIMGVLVVASVLQGGTSNWLTGFFCIGVYLIIATGFFFHQVEDLSVDEELLLRNSTRRDSGFAGN